LPAALRSALADLKKSNAKLVEKNLSKDQKPPSLKLQRDKVNDLNCQIQELQFVQGSLKEELESAKQNLRTASIKHRIAEYSKAQDYHLEQIRRAQDLLSQFKAVIAEIEGLKTLEQLVRINSDLNCKRLSDYGVDLGEVLANFKRTNLSCDFDFSRIENLNISLQNLINQLDAIHKGKRGFHKVQAKKVPQKIPSVEPLHQARKYEQYRLKSQDDLKKALEGKIQIIPHHR
jgi:pimeloyl-CoA synthetase